MKKSAKDKKEKKTSAIWQQVGRLSEALESCRMDEKALASLSDDLNELASWLGITPRQCALFAAILHLNFRKRRVSMDMLSRYFDCSGVSMLQYIDDLEELKALKWIRSDSGSNHRRSLIGEISFFVRREVVDRLMKGEITPGTKKLDNIYHFLTEVYALGDDYKKDRISRDEMWNEVEALIQDNRHFPYTLRLKEEQLSEHEELLFMLVCRDHALGIAGSDLDNLVQVAGGAPWETSQLRGSLIRGNNPLIRKDLLRLSESNFRMEHELVITEKALRIFLPEDCSLQQKSKAPKKGVRKGDSLRHVRLFYNEDEKVKITQLQRLLSLKGEQGVNKRLEEQNLTTGFTILLHGCPGTGKTESVYQLARKSKRDVMKVDLSQTKNMWFGESEKMVKQIFHDYRDLLSHSTRTPILLFNEADGLFSKRMDLSASNMSQTHNSIQNILLDEMENFEGILVATTNLTMNFDRAFERRFLFKIQLSPPDENTRQQIWKSKIPALPVSTARKLAREYRLSGGQIENVARKYAIETVLSGESPDYPTLSSFCQEESLEKQKHIHVGFKKPA